MPGLGAGVDRELLVAVERRQLDLGPERGLGDRDRDVGDEIVVDPAIAVVRLHAEVDVEIAAGTAARAGRTATR